MLFHNRSTREIITWASGLLTLVAGGAWTVWTYYHPARPSAASPATTTAPSVSAASGGVAIGGDANHATITVNGH